MTIVRLDLAYDGARFAGWAAQPGSRTVQGELEEALARVLGRPVRLTVAGRTDAGVHAWGQVASFEADGEPPEELGRALNALTGADLAVNRVSIAPGGFDARRSALARTYCYRLLAAPVPSPFERGRSLFWPHRLDRDLLGRCSAALPGTHDFTAFTPTETEHVRFEREVLRAEWETEESAGAVAAAGGQVLRFWIEADAFMRNMVRVLVGTILEVAAGRRDAEEFQRLLQGAPREAAGETARAEGLYLASVRY